MSKFSNLQKYEIAADKAVKYDLVDIQMNGKTPFVMVKPATEANKPFAKAQLARSNKRIKAASARGVSLETLEASRDDDRDLYPKHIITGWGNVFDNDGGEVAFSVENCKEFLDALPGWIFDALRVFCTTPSNFAGVVDGEELGN
jgi:hypothetical protein